MRLLGGPGALPRRPVKLAADPAPLALDGGQGIKLLQSFCDVSQPAVVADRLYDKNLLVVGSELSAHVCLEALNE